MQVASVVSYIERTALLLRPTVTRRLFLSVFGRSVGTSTIARWLKSAVSLAGADMGVFSAFSTRGATALRDFQIRVPTDQTLVANWRRESACNLIYKRGVWRGD